MHVEFHVHVGNSVPSILFVAVEDVHRAELTRDGAVVLELVDSAAERLRLRANVLVCADNAILLPPPDGFINDGASSPSAFLRHVFANH